jgi:hypothetical protein
VLAGGGCSASQQVVGAGKGKKSLTITTTAMRHSEMETKRDNNRLNSMRLFPAATASRLDTPYHMAIITQPRYECLVDLTSDIASDPI